MGSGPNEPINKYEFEMDPEPFRSKMDRLDNYDCNTDIFGDGPPTGKRIKLSDAFNKPQ